MESADEPTPQHCAPQLQSAQLHTEVALAPTAGVPTLRDLSPMELQDLLLSRNTAAPLVALVRAGGFTGQDFAKPSFMANAFPVEVRSDSLRVPLARLSRVHKDLCAAAAAAAAATGGADGTPAVVVSAPPPPTPDVLATPPHATISQASAAAPAAAAAAVAAGSVGCAALAEEFGALPAVEACVTFAAHDDGTGEYIIAYDAARRAFAVQTLTVNHLAGHDGEVSAVCGTADGAVVLTGSSDATARVWDAQTGKEMRRLQGHAAALTAVAVHGGRLATASWDKSARLWENPAAAAALPPRQAPASVLRGHTNAVSSLAFSPDGERLATGGADDVITVWVLAATPPSKQQQPAEVLMVLKGHRGTVLSLAFAASGKALVSGSEDFSAKLWDLETKACVATFEGHTFAVTSVCFGLDGAVLVTGSCDETARVWHVATRQTLHTLNGHRGSVTSVAAAGDRVATGSDDGTVRLWSLTSGLLLASVVGHRLGVTSLALLADGYRLVTGSADGTARVWFLETARDIATFPAVGGEGPLAATSIHMSGDRTLLVTIARPPTADTPSSLVLWHVSDGASVSFVQPKGLAPLWTVVAFDPCPSAAAGSVGRRCAAAGSDDGSLAVWRADTGECLCWLPKAHSNQRIVALAFASPAAIAAAAAAPAAGAAAAPGNASSSSGSRLLLRSRDASHRERIWDANSGAKAMPSRFDAEGHYFFSGA